MDENPSLPPSGAAASRRRSWRGQAPGLLIAAAIIALVLLAWQWMETRARLDLLQQQVAQRLGESDAAAREVRNQSRELLDRIQTQGNRVAVLEARLAEAQGQQAALEALYQDFSRSRDEWTLTEVEQAINIAQQQLQLAGNVPAALVALQSAEQRLSTFERPQLLPLRKALARDIERLKALPLADVASLGLSIENLIERIDTLPLAFEHSPSAPVAAASKPVAKAAPKNARPARGTTQPAEQSAPEPSESHWLQSLAMDVWQPIQRVIRIERLDRPDPVLLSPSQTVFLRENLRLRLLSARLALLQRDGRVFREDTRQAADWIERYFDVTDRDVAQRAAELKRMQSVRLSLELPNLNDTMAALRNVRLAATR